MANYILPFTTGGAGSINSVFLTGKNSNIMAIDNCEIGLRPGKEYLWKPGGGKVWNNGWTWPARVLVQGSFSFVLSRRAATTGIQFCGGGCCSGQFYRPSLLTLDSIFGWDGNLRRRSSFRISCSSVSKSEWECWERNPVPRLPSLVTDLYLWYLCCSFKRL